MPPAISQKPDENGAQAAPGLAATATLPQREGPARAPGTNATQLRGAKKRQDRLDHAAPRAGSAEAPASVPLEARMVIGQWSQDAGDEKRREHGDRETARLMQGTHNALRHMNRTIADNISNNVFALMTGEKYEDVQAIATITAHAGAGKACRAVDVRELVARPGAEAHAKGSELLRRIHGWAAGCPVTVSLSRELLDYYEAVGYDPRDMVSPDVVSRGSSLESPSGPGAVRMRALLLRPAPRRKDTGPRPTGGKPEQPNVNDLQASINAMGQDSTRLWTETLHRTLAFDSESDNKSSLAYM